MDEIDFSNAPPDVQAMAISYIRQQKDKEDLMRYQLDSKQIISDMLLEWQGLTLTEKGEAVQDDNKIRLINYKGAAQILSFVYPRLTKIVTLSNLDEETIKKMTVDFMDNITFLLAKHHIEFEVVSYQAMDSIIDTCGDLYYASLMKAKGAGERDTLRKTYNLTEDSTHRDANMQPQNKRPSLFSVLGF